MAKLIIHGGAGTVAPERQDAYRRGLRAALSAGWAVLAAGGPATEAVMRAVETMEANSEAFNAGVGGSPNREGEVELDACIMSGSDGSAGAVAAVRSARSAVRLADLVRRETPHVLLVGAGAEALISDPLDPAELLTPYTRETYRRWREGQERDDATPSDPSGGTPPTGSATVGAVALDDHGALAAATSTGGMLGKWPGRVGDAPIPGAGTYADRRVGVSTTGFGEAFLRAVSAKAIAERLAFAQRSGQATPGVLGELLSEALADVRALEGRGGIIAIGADGEIAYDFDTRHLAVAWTDGSRELIDVLEGA